MIEGLNLDGCHYDTENIGLQVLGTGQDGHMCNKKMFIKKKTNYDTDMQTREYRT